MSEPHHEVGDEDSSGNRPEPEPEPRRGDPDGPLEDEDAKARPGHPGSAENFRGGD
ncbi:hypothetical protein [Amycolatopsis sp. SID8362]|uniref:hypothetical protein n=1 Tax=Amycolatopsis sp. SID8362 TaxID=2690346 RepID=UPI0013720F90|nr:hypothetical protein [Amycolatopsis sp. SID8362]NBH03272.1 hypothetical protein [Amycolatopsis sp. SID8362]NED39973.1 hypothetical protein [Amycolatopsis sp. SID8362]